MWKDINNGKGLASILDKRSKTSAINGSKGGRPKELMDWDGGLPDEVWRPIPKYESYFVSNIGRVISIKRGTPRLRRQTTSKGYKFVSLWQEGRNHTGRVHRLVLSAFIGACPDGCEGSHKDGNRDNNCLDNLIWESGKENAKRKHEHGTTARGKKIIQCKLSESDVPVIRELYRNGATPPKIGKRFGVTGSTISNLIAGRTWSYVK